MASVSGTVIMRRWIWAVLLAFLATLAQAAGHHRHHHHYDPNHMALRSATVLVLDQTTQQVLYSKNPDPVHPIASITKLMTALVVLDSGQKLDEKLVVAPEDMDMLRHSRSHLPVGSEASRLDFLRMALIASENRAAAALGRSYPGGIQAFVQKMNEEAQRLGMKNTHFTDSSGLNAENVSTAHDLALLVEATEKFPLISEITTTSSVTLPVGPSGREVQFHNTNPLVANKSRWTIGLSKTGYINESGQCLVMQASVHGHPMIFVLLDSHGYGARISDAIRVRQWLEYHEPQVTVGQL